MGNHPSQIFENFIGFQESWQELEALDIQPFLLLEDNTIEMYSKVLTSLKCTPKKGFFVPFPWFTCLSNPDFSKKIASIHNILEYDWLQWKINLGNSHWVSVYHSAHDGNPLFYWDSLSTNADRKCRMTNKMVAAINNFGAQYQLKWECNNAVSFVNAPQQRKNGNDYWAAGNELGCRLLFNEQTVDFPLNSIGSQLRCTQAAEILKFVLSEGV